MFRSFAFLAWLLPAVPATAAEPTIVENGKSRAEIVIAENPKRTVRVAAHELRSYVQKISGATLPIRTAPSADVPVQLYVGQSPHTEKLGLTIDGLKHGAYRIASGPNWLAFLGDDTEFVPIEPWARNNADIRSGKLQSEWEKITGAKWGAPNGGMYKNRMRLPGDTGKPDGVETAKNETLDIWSFDERGTYNAVCGWLRSLGVRWYLPGELGEVVPQRKSIVLTPINETVKPDFAVRKFNIRFAVTGTDTAFWAMRLGLRDANDIQVAHGLATMTSRDEIFREHPDWFALYGGKRHYRSDTDKNQLCYSNEEFFNETVKYARAMFDNYKYEAVSIMPPDGYTAICQCPLCEGKDSPERDNRGLLSDYVWDFVNRVAKEVAKTHPDKKILNCAYGVYTQPPLKIEKLEPNVVVCIVGGRRPTADTPEQQEELRKLREAWAAKTANPIMIFENYPFTDRGWYLPSFLPHTIGNSINASKDISNGEDIWLSVNQKFATDGIGFNHFQTYFTARMYWGGKSADIDAVFREYVRLFYGPAEQEMLAFFEFCEANWKETEKDKAKADQALALFDAAKAKVPADSIYSQRIALIDEFLKGLRNKSVQLAKKRGPVPTIRLVGEARSKIVIDGKLDEPAWTDCPAASTSRMRELQAGGVPTYGTTVKSAWSGGNLYFAVRCEERPGDKPTIAATRNDDAAIWYGDVVEFLIETESRSYYQIAVNPAGSLADLDRSAGKNGWFNWSSQAEVATHVADDHWTIEIRIPVTEDENDPLHQVIGRKPTGSLPWHVNVCRQRVRGDAQEHSAVSPTGTGNFHNVMKFAHFFDGKSRQFETAEPDDDFLTGLRRAGDLARQRKTEEAIAAYAALATEKKRTDFQKSLAMQEATQVATAAKSYDRAAELAEKIPIEAVKKTAIMQQLLSQGKASALISKFGNEDIDSWPFWKAGDGFAVRGRAYAALGQGKEADADLTRAVQVIGDPRIRQSVWLAAANNRERNLKDDAATLEAFRAVLGRAERFGGADEFNALLGIARTLTRQKKYDEALETLQKVNADTLSGIWRGSMKLAAAEVFAAAGRTDEAVKAYQAIAADTKVEERQRQTATEKVKKLQGE